MRKSFVAALAAAALAMPAFAKEKPPVFVESLPVKDKPVVALNAQKAYVLLRTDQQQSLYLMKIPSPQDQAAYDRLRAGELKKAHAKYLKKKAQYDAAVKSAANQPKGTPRPKLPDVPIEPTEENFEFTAFGVLAGVSIGPINRFAKSDGVSTYLQEVTPGDYRIYGPLWIGPDGIAYGSCYCMGSVRFQARAGEIVDMGVILSKGADLPKPPPGDSTMPVIMSVAEFLTPASASLAPDPRLGRLPIVPARYRPVGKLPNYWGVTIGRIQAMPGVLRYDRDRIVDLTSGD